MDNKSLLIDGTELAKLLRVSKRTLGRMLEDGKLPDPVASFAQPRWSRTVIEQWVNSGCPERKRIYVP